MWIRCVDDTFVILENDELKNTYCLINNVFYDIKLTMDKKLNNKLSYLGVLITRIDTRKLEPQVYRKLTHADQNPNYSSNNPKIHKINCVLNLFKKGRIYCSTLAALEICETCLMTIPQKNGYPRDFINIYIN